MTCVTRVIFLLSLIAAPLAYGHPASIASGIVKVERDGRISISFYLDLPAFVLNDIPERVNDDDMFALLELPVESLQGQLDETKSRLLATASVDPGNFDSAKFPVAEEIVRWKQAAGDPPRLPLMMDIELAGELPADASSFTLKMPEALGTTVLTLELPDEEPRAYIVPAGVWTPPFPVKLTAAPTTQPQTQAAESSPPARLGWIRTLIDFSYLGFTHILPHGLDHVLFVLGLFLLSPKWRPLLWQISAFTIAHSITLAMAMLDIVRLPPEIVEPLIAASIAFVAIENLWTNKLKPWRPIVVFVFGLIHGLGFAGVLMDLPIPGNDFVAALVGFNVGVEFGQLAVVVLALAAVGWFQNANWYRKAIVIPASTSIALLALFWTVERMM